MLKDTYAPIISKAMTTSAKKELEKKITAYVDRNSEILLTLDISRRYSFGDNDRQVLYDTCNIDINHLTTDISNAKGIYSGNKIQSNPFYIASTLVASHFLNSKDANMASVVVTYMSLMMWTSLHKGFFKYEANKQVMDYTIAHLDSSFKIRQFPSLFAFIQDNTTTVIATYSDRIKRAEDTDLTWVIDAIWTRLKGKIKKISSEFYKNHESGRYLNSDEDDYSEDNFHEMDNVSFGVDRLVNKVYTKLINRQYDKRFIKYSIMTSDTSLKKLTNLIEDIIDSSDEAETIRGVIGAMIEYYLQQSGKTIDYVAKGDFVAYMKTAYASNTVLPQMEYIKSSIDHWLAANMYKYGRANYGKTLQIQYRRCIYMFLVFVINYEAKAGL